MPDVLRLLGEAVGSDRCTVGQDEIIAGTTLSVRAIAEWCRIGVTSAIDIHPEFEAGVEPFTEIYRPLAQGESVNTLVADLSEPVRSFMTQQGITSLLLVPILVQGQSWGHFASDNCNEPRLYDEAEIAILQVAADSLAAAIERQAKDEELLRLEQERSQQPERLNAELQQAIYRLERRDRWLDATAEAANVLLSNTDLVTGINEALRVIGETIDVDRVEVFQHIYDFTRGRLGFIREIYEWDSPYATRQLSHPELNEFSNDEYLEELWLSLMSGAWWGGIIDELPDPFRSGQIELGVQSTYAVPIFVDSTYWGFIAIDHCREKKKLTESEIAVFRTAAACLGSAIQSDRTQKAMLQAEQERSQELERLNAELQQALQQISKSEELYRSLFEISNEGIWRWELDQPLSLDLPVEQQLEQYYESVRFIQSNDTFVKIYGLAYAEDVKWLRLKDLHVTDSEKNLAFIRTLIENDHEIRNMESEEADANGQRRYFLNSIASLIDNNCVIGGWGTQIDITELREAQQALLKAERDRFAELAKTNQALKNSPDRLAADLDLDAFLGHVLLEITEQLQTEVCYLHLYDSQAQILNFHILINHSQIQLKHEAQVHESLVSPSVHNLPIWEILLNTDQPCVIDLANCPEQAAPGTSDWQIQEGYQAGINILLTLGSEPLAYSC